MSRAFKLPALKTTALTPPMVSRAWEIIIQIARKDYKVLAYLFHDFYIVALIKTI